jgi:hypothetical protein
VSKVSPPVFFLPCTFKPPRRLAGEADLPSSGTGRRGCPRHPPDPLGLLARSPATRRAHTRARWHPEQQDRVRRRFPGKAPPRSPCLRRRRRRPSRAHVQGRQILRGRPRSHTPSFKWDGPPWTRAPGARRGPRCTRAPVTVGSEIHGAELAILFKSP